MKNMLVINIVFVKMIPYIWLPNQNWKSQVVYLVFQETLYEVCCVDITVSDVNEQVLVPSVTEN